MIHYENLFRKNIGYINLTKRAAIKVDRLLSTTLTDWDRGDFLSLYKSMSKITRTKFLSQCVPIKHIYVKSIFNNNYLFGFTYSVHFIILSILLSNLDIRLISTLLLSFFIGISILLLEPRYHYLKLFNISDNSKDIGVAILKHIIKVSPSKVKSNIFISFELMILSSILIVLVIILNIAITSLFNLDKTLLFTLNTSNFIFSTSLDSVFTILVILLPLWIYKIINNRLIDIRIRNHLIHKASNIRFIIDKYAILEVN